MAELQTGDPAPLFELPRSGGGSVSLQNLRGREVILFFYPKDDTPGCTIEACSFRDVHADFTSRDAIVLGISPDSVRSHDRFAEKYGLPFALLADVDHSVAESYGVWTSKTMYGKSYMGVQRSTFLIAADGRIKKIWGRVKPEGHAQDVLTELSAPPVPRTVAEK